MFNKNVKRVFSILRKVNLGLLIVYIRKESRTAF